MAKRLSITFKSLKAHSNSVPKPADSPRKQPQIFPPNNPSTSESPPASRSPSTTPWIVYLILSTNPPIKTYVGVTTNFSRRLKQHNGELKGGAKASRPGRPWICACLINGFKDKSQAYEFEAKWKSSSRKLSRKRKGENLEQTENPHLLLLQHRYTALNQVKDLTGCDLLKINWHVDPV